MTVIKLMHSSMQFSDSNAQHAHDAKKVFDYAAHTDVWAISGTESGEAHANHDLHDALVREAAGHNFAIYAHKFGEWVALNRAHLRSTRHGYEGPFIPGSHGLTAAQGAHSPRGVVWMQGTPRVKGLGTLTFGAAHYLTQRSINAGHHDNSMLQAGIATWAHEFGDGGRKVFIGADTNMQDARRDVFAGKPLTTCWDELKKHPSTGHGNIDVIASYDPDRRVSCKAAHVLDDSALFLFTDHYSIVAEYEGKTR